MRLRCGRWDWRRRVACELLARTIELTGYLGSGFIHGAGAQRRQPDNFRIVVERRRAFDPLRERRIADSVFLLRHIICLTGLSSSRVNFLLSRTTEVFEIAAEVRDVRHRSNCCDIGTYRGEIRDRGTDLRSYTDRVPPWRTCGPVVSRESRLPLNLRRHAFIGSIFVSARDNACRRRIDRRCLSQ